MVSDFFVAAARSAPNQYSDFPLMQIIEMGESGRESAMELKVGSKRCQDAFGNGPKVNMREVNMLGWAVTFLIVALVAAVLGFGGIAGAAVDIAKLIFFVAIVLFAISAVVGLLRGRSATRF